MSVEQYQRLIGRVGIFYGACLERPDLRRRMDQRLSLIGLLMEQLETQMDHAEYEMLDTGTPVMLSDDERQLLEEYRIVDHMIRRGEETRSAQPT